MMNEKLTSRLKRLVYNLGNIDMFTTLALAVLIVGVRDVIISGFHNMVVSHDFVFYFVTYALLFSTILFFISIGYCVPNTEKEMKKLGIDVIK